MTRTSGKSRLTRSAMVAAVLIAVTGGALFGAIQLSRATTRAATSLHTADQAIRAATIARSHLALAHLGSEEQREISIEETGLALEALDRALDDLEELGDYPDELESGRHFATIAAAVLSETSGSDTDQEELEMAFRDAVTDFDALRGRLVGEIELAGSRYGLIGILLGIATAGLAPLVMMLWTRSVAKRSLELRALSHRLEQETRIREARSAVLRTVVHEFRTPLTGISGLAAVLEDREMRQSSEAAEMVEMIRMEAEDLSHLTDDILTSARLEAEQLEIQPEEVDVGASVGQVVSMLEGRGIAVDVKYEPGVVRADPLRFRQILRNLISNAAKYGGDTIAVEGSVEGNSYMLRVLDDGDGVPPEVLPKLFQAFPHEGTQTDSNVSVGLGLAISHQLAEAMGGWLTYTRSGELTVFTLGVPLARVVLEEPAPEGAIEVGA